MTPTTPRVLYYINQFFAGIGGEEQANHAPELRPEAVGPARLLAKTWPEATVVGTLICGDNFFQEQPAIAADAVRDAIRELAPDVVIAGPAFVSGRYGLACGEVARLAQEAGVPALAAMSPDNPAVVMYRSSVYVVATGDKPTSMGAAMAAMSAFAVTLAAGAEIGSAEDEGYLPRGYRRPVVRSQPSYLRAVDMLVAKVHGRPYVSEIPYIPMDQVAPAAPVADLAKARVALVTTGGLIRKGNPDGQSSSNAKRFLRFDVSGMPRLDAEHFEAFHAGYLNTAASDNPNYIAPLGYCRDLRERGEIGDVLDTVYSLVGVNTPEETARNLGGQIADELVSADVDAVLLVST